VRSVHSGPALHAKTSVLQLVQTKLTLARILCVTKQLCVTKLFHPNIDVEGKVCLNILRDEWKPVLGELVQLTSTSTSTSTFTFAFTFIEFVISSCISL
jgi:hypothetical protein